MGAKLTLEGTSTGAVAAVKELQSAFDKLEKGVQPSVREMNALEKAAKRVVDQNLTPYEKYTRQLETMSKAVAACRMEMTQFESTAARMKKRLDEAGQSHDSLFSKGLQGIGQYMTGIFGIGAALGAVSAGFKQVEQDATSAANRVMTSLGDVGELQQVSSSPEDFAKNMARARGLVRSGSMPDMGQATNLVFGEVSAGYSEDEKDLIGKIGERKFVKPDGLLGLAEGLQKYRATFGDADAGSLKDVTNKVIQAAGTAQASVPETLKALLEVGAGGKSLGMSDEQTTAGFLAVERQSPNSEIAATKFRSFLDQANKKGLFSKDIPGTIANIDGRVKKGENIFDVLGETRAVQAYENLRTSGDFMAQQQGLLETAPSRDLFESQSNLLATDPLANAALVASRAKARRETTDERLYARAKLLTSAVRDEETERDGERGGFITNFIGRPLRKIQETAEDTFGGQGRFLNNLTESEVRGLSPETAAAVREFQRDSLDVQKQQLKILQKLEEQSRPGPGRPSGRQE